MTEEERPIESPEETASEPEPQIEPAVEALVRAAENGEAVPPAEPAALGEADVAPPAPAAPGAARREPAASSGVNARGGKSSARPSLSEEREPLFREALGFRLRLEPADLVRLRELPGSRGRSDRELGEEFFEKQAERLARALAEDVAPPAEVRVVVDPYSRQAFLAIERTIRSILSF